MTAVTPEVATRMRMLISGIQLRIYGDATLPMAARERLIAEMTTEFETIDRLEGVIR